MKYKLLKNRIVIEKEGIYFGLDFQQANELFEILNSDEVRAVYMNSSSLAQQVEQMVDNR